uniref:Uncharacterized protein n=1 Tax=Timema monikensis TaxID=170555 RepID=A0A7R9E8Q4_9NEOP|nr:unnamed protein product [Timema monikensis]
MARSYVELLVDMAGVLKLETFSDTKIEYIDDLAYLSWSNHQEVILGNLWGSRDDPSQCDLIFVTSDLHHVYAHSCILAAGYFRNLAENICEDMKDIVILVKDLTSQDLQAFLDYIYKGEVEFCGSEEEFKAVMSGWIDFDMLPICDAQPCLPLSGVLAEELTLYSLKDDELLKNEHLNMESNISTLISTNTESSSPLLETDTSPLPETYLPISNPKCLIAQDTPQNKVSLALSETSDGMPKLKYCEMEDASSIENGLPGSVKDLSLNTEDIFGLEVPEHKNKVEERQEVRSGADICQTCQLRFDSRSDFRKHLLVHPDGKMLRCEYCSKGFLKPSHLKIHLRSHTGARPFQCQSCGKHLISKSSLTKHLLTHKRNKEDMFACDICSKSFLTKEYLVEHIRVHTGSKPFQCSQCPMSFVGRTGLNHHVKKHAKGEDKNDTVCDICGKTLSRHALWGHIKTHKKMERCNICNKVFSTTTALKIHSRTSHLGQRDHQCEKCGKIFLQWSHLSRHIKSHTPKPQQTKGNVSCKECLKTFKKEKSLLYHKECEHKEPGECIYPCDFCPKRFVGRSTATYHMRSHTDTRPHVCTSCGRGFIRPDSLRLHMARHRGEKPYACLVCGRKFTSKRSMNKHAGLHKAAPPLDKHLSVPHHCGICKKNFETEDELTNHSQSHVGARPFRCAVCRKTFRYLDSLKRHARVHSTVVPDAPIELQTLYALQVNGQPLEQVGELNEGGKLTPQQSYMSETVIEVSEDLISTGHKEIIISDSVVMEDGICLSVVEGWGDPAILLPDDKIANLTFGNYFSDMKRQIMSINEEEPAPVTLCQLNITGGTATVDDISLSLTINTTTVSTSLFLAKGVSGGGIVILLNKTLDYDDQNAPKEYAINILMGGITARIQLTVINVNDNPPQIDADKSTCNIPQQEISTTFSFVEDEVIDNYNMLYNISVDEKLDYVTKSIYSLRIVATDGLFTTMYMYFVQVLNIASRAPKWQTSPSVFQGAEKEEHQVKFVAIDGDIGLNQAISYRLEDLTEGDKDRFSINETSGILTIAWIDRDILASDIFTFTVVAYKGAEGEFNVSTVPMTVIVLDINDHTPNFTTTETEIWINETSTSLNMKDSIRIQDPDLALNGTFDIRLQEHPDYYIGTNWSSNFLLVPTRGYQDINVTLAILNGTKLDYETPEWRDIYLQIVVTERANSMHVNTSNFVIHLNDINNKWPIFDNSSYEVFVYENATKGEFVISCHATDADFNYTDKVTHSLLPESQTSLTINPDTGDVTVNRDNPFNYMQQTEVFLQVLAEDTNDPPHQTYAQLKIKVIEVDNQPPVITSPYDQVHVNENATESTVVTELTATDPDSMANVTLSIDWKTSYATKNGARVLNNSLYDRCMIIKTTPNTSPNNVTGTITVQKTDVFPMKNMDWGEFDTLFLMIIATDWNTVLPAFATNMNRSVLLAVSIIDVNDNPPVFSQQEYSVNVIENTVPNTLITIITATDADGPGNNEISYTIDLDYSSTGNNEDKNRSWIIDNPVSGHVETGPENIDCEYVHNMIYIITATDGVFNTSVQLNVTIIDVNDNWPIVQEVLNIISINETQENGTVILNMKNNSYDLDYSEPFHTLYYQMDFMIDDQLMHYFYLDIDTGNLLAVFTNPNIGFDLAFTNRTSFSLRVTIRDNFKERQIANSNVNTNSSYTIYIKDVNNHKPVFQPVNGNLFETNTHVVENLLTRAIAESQNLFTRAIAESQNLLTRAIAESQNLLTKAIAVFQSLLTRSIEVFQTLPTRTIGVSQPLLARAVSQPLLTKVIGVSRPLLTKAIGVSKPLLTRAIGVYQPLLTRTLAVSQPLLTKAIGDSVVLSYFHATDADSDAPNNWIHYEILSITSVNGNNANPSDLFWIKDNEDNKTATIMAGKGLNDSYGNYSIIFYAEDRGEYPGPLNQTSDPYTIVIKGYNDHAPVFVFPNKSVDHLVLSKLTIQAYDGGPEPLSTNRTLKIYIKSGDLKEPYFETQIDTANFTENTTVIADYVPDSEYHTLPGVIDPDKDVNDVLGLTEEIYYYLFNSTNDGMEHFLVDKSTGILKVDPNNVLDRETYNNYTIGIVVTKKDTKPKYVETKSFLTVNIKVIDIKDTPPNFKEDIYSGGLLLGDKNGKTIFVVEATDYDEDDEITFTISSDIHTSDSSLNSWVQKPFLMTQSNQIDQVTRIATANGTLTNNFDLEDSNMKGHFTFEIKATDLDSIRRVTTRASLTSENSTDVTTHFINTATDLPVDAADIQLEMNIQDKVIKLKLAFSQKGLLFESYQGGSKATEAQNMEQVLQTVLIVVSVVLGTLVVVLFAAFFFRTRSLNRRLESLSTTKFGSQDSGLNRIGMAMPNTNKHALDGSNPVWKNENLPTRDIDTTSIGSGDSDLIGIENSPEFNHYQDTGMRRESFNPLYGYNGVSDITREKEGNSNKNSDINHIMNFTERKNVPITEL